MTSQTIKINGLAEYSPMTIELQQEYNGLKTNVAKRRLILDCLRNGYALEKMGLGDLIGLLERQGFAEMSEREKCDRFLSLVAALTATQPLTPPAPPAATVIKADPVPPPAATSSSTGPKVTINEDDLSSTREELAPKSATPAARKLGRATRNT